MTQIREYRPADAQAVVDLSLRAWTPVFTSLERILGRDLFARLHGDWRGHQEAAVRGELADGAVRAWVAETGPGVIGFVTAALRGSGMRVAMVETGGDAGHAPARRAYEKAGYTLLPVARYFRAL